MTNLDFNDLCIGIVFSQFGPYHHARVSALQREFPGRVIPAQIASATSTYAWTNMNRTCDGLVTLCKGAEENVSPLAAFFAARRFFITNQVHTVLLPSYSPPRVFAVYLAAVSCGCRRIMMNESHAATENASGFKKILKRLIVKGFHSALVGGTPQQRHFETLGLPASKIFTGYDAIDNHYFASEALLARSNAKHRRKELGLPERYFLNLGRFVPKKDLKTLVRAYAAFRKQSTEEVDLVLVGSGEDEQELKQLANSLGLEVHEPKHKFPNTERKVCDQQYADARRIDVQEPQTDARQLMGPSVYFMGFQQISLNPSFYALADAFILPSVLEEWGLVINEAMACGLPVIVTRAVGCGEDLVINNVNGFFFEPGDVDGLARILMQISVDPALRHTMGIASSERIANWGCKNFATNAMLAVQAAR